MKYLKGSLLYEGKAKRVFRTDHPDKFLVHFKNDITAFNSKKHAQLNDKGILNCQISALIFQFLKEKGVPNHFLRIEDECWMLVQKVEVIPLEVVVRNIASGSLCRETPLKPSTKLSRPLVDFYYKDDDLGDPLLTDERLELLELISKSQKNDIRNLALQVNNS